MNSSLNFENQTGNFSVTFVRPFITSENQTGKDANLTATVRDFVWAYGSIVDYSIVPPEQ